MARILATEGVPTDYQEQKPDRAEILPSTLVPGTGPLAFRPSIATSPSLCPGLEIMGTSSSRTHEQERDSPTSRRMVSSPAVPESCMLPTSSLASSSFPPYDDDGDASIRIETYLFPPPDEYGGETATVIMSRQSQEPATKCMQRLEISIAKKLKTLFQKGSERKKVKGQVNLPKISTSIHCQGGDHKFGTGNFGDDTTAEEFWTLALGSSMQIDVYVDSTIVIPLVVECNPPTITSISTFEKFRGKLFPGIPVVLEVETAFATSVVVDWFVNEDRVCSDSLCYTPTTEDGNKRLSVLVTPVRPDHDGSGCQEAYQFSNSIEGNLPQNALLHVRPDWLLTRSQAEADPDKPLRVMSYNILADQNAFESDSGEPFFPWAKKEILHRGRRMPLLLHEILSYHADVVCLQEVDEFVYDTLFRPVMSYFNYQGYYSVKCTGGTKEGCALFFSLNRFQRCQDEDLKTFSISKLLSEIPTATESEWKACEEPIANLFSRRTDLLELLQSKLGHVVQIARLRDLDGNSLLAANTHLFYHPKATHIRALQCFAIAKQLSIEQGSQRIPFVLCGDFNSDLWSAATLLMKRRTPKNYSKFQLHLSSFTWEENSSEENSSVEGNEPFDDDFPELRLPDSFPDIVSGYSAYPDYTHYIVGFKASLDHILMSSSTSLAQLQPLRHATIPPLVLVESGTAMPGPTFPSDHISILCEIEWKPIN